jgi:hypothetical protein
VPLPEWLGLPKDQVENILFALLALTGIGLGAGGLKLYHDHYAEERRKAQLVA